MLKKYSNLSRDIILTYTSQVITSATPIIFSPLYVKYLGLSSWGLVSFVMSVQVIFFLFEQGYSQGLVNGFVKANQKNPTFFPNLVHLVLRKYFFYATYLVILILLLSYFIIPIIMDSNLTNQAGAIKLLVCLTLMIIFQMVSSLFRAALTSINLFGQLALINIFIQLFRHGLGFFFVVLSNRASILLGWFAFSYLIEAIIRGFILYKHLSKRKLSLDCYVKMSKNYENRLISLISKRSMRMAVAVLLGAISLYMDRLVVAKFLSFEALGVYSLASMVAMGVIQFIYPLGQVMLPKMILVQKKRESVAEINYWLLKRIILISAIVGTIFIFYGEQILEIWLADKSLVTYVYPILNIMLLGSLSHALFNLRYWNLIANGDYKKITQIYIGSIFLGIVIMPAATINFGLPGAAWAWVISGFYLAMFFFKSFLK